MSLPIHSIEPSASVIPSLSTTDIDPDALWEAWETLLEQGGQNYLSPEFIQAICKKFSDLTQKISELQQAIIDQDEEKIAELTNEVNALKADLNTIINGSQNPPVFSLQERIDLLKELEENRQNIEESDYQNLRQKLLELDPTRTVTAKQFHEQLQQALNQTARKKSEEAVANIQASYQNSLSKQKMLAKSITMRVLQAKNNHRTLNVNNQIEKNTQRKSESDPVLQQFYKEGIWNIEKEMRQQELIRKERAEEFNKEWIKNSKNG